MIEKYHIEFILHAYDSEASLIKSALSEFGEEVGVEEAPSVEGSSGKEYLVKISAQDPTLVFDVCSQMGRIRSVKIDEQEGKWR